MNRFGDFGPCTHVHRFVVDTILFIEPMLKKYKIVGKDIQQKIFIDRFIKKKILIGDSKKQEKLIQFFDKLRQDNCSTVLENLHRCVCFWLTFEDFSIKQYFLCSCSERNIWILFGFAVMERSEMVVDCMA